MHCIAEKARNVSDVLTNAVKERYERLHDHVIEVKEKAKQRVDNIQQSLQELKDKVEQKHSFLLNVAKKINQFSDKCVATMTDLNKKCQNVFKTCGKNKRSTKNLGLDYISPDFHNFTEYQPIKDIFLRNSSVTKRNVIKSEHSCSRMIRHSAETHSKLTILPQIAQYNLMSLANGSNSDCDMSSIETVPQVNQSGTANDINGLSHEDIGGLLEDNAPHHVYYQNKSRYNSHPHLETLHTGKVFHLRTRRSIFDFIICFFKAVFSIVLRPICDIIFNSIAYLCKIPKLVTHFITSIILKKFYYLEETVKKNAWIELDADMTFEREIIEVRSAKQAMKELEERLTDRFSFSPFVFLDLADYLKIISFLLVYWRTYVYITTYLSDSSFDNVYIDRFLIRYDKRAEKSIFPIKKSDESKYTIMTRLSMSTQE